MIKIVITCFFILSFSHLSFANYSFNPAEHPEYQDRGGNPQIFTWLSDTEFINDQEFGFIHNNKPFRFIMTTRDQLVWDVLQSFDENSVRVTPQTDDHKRKNFIALFGCSFTVGTGVQDHDTISYFLAKNLPNHKIYNLGIGASAPNMMLAYILSDRFSKIVKEKNGLFIYIGGQHVGRANAYYMESWMQNTPYFEYDENGEFKKVGTWAEAHALRVQIYKLMRFLQNKYFPQYTFNWPPVSQKHYQYNCDLVAESVKAFEKKYQGSRMIVYSHPSSFRMEPEVVTCLRQRNVVVLEGDIPFEGGDFYLDGHPTGSFNSKFGQKLANEIRPYIFK